MEDGSRMGYTDDEPYTRSFINNPQSYPQEGLLSACGCGIVETATQVGDSRGNQRVEKDQSVKIRDCAAVEKAGFFWDGDYPADPDLYSHYAPFLPKLQIDQPCG